MLGESLVEESRRNLGMDVGGGEGLSGPGDVWGAVVQIYSLVVLMRYLCLIRDNGGEQVKKDKRERDDSVGRVNSRAKALFNLGCDESP